MSGALQLLGQLVHNREGTTQNEVSELNINMMPEADENTITLMNQLNNQTRKLVGDSFFNSMKETAYFINTCRGGTVDENALINALNSQKISGAGIDVFEIEPTAVDNPLFYMDNVIVTPHSAGTSNRARVAAQIQVGQEAARLLNGTWPMSLVNPEVRAQIEVRPLATS